MPTNGESYRRTFSDVERVTITEKFENGFWNWEVLMFGGWIYRPGRVGDYPLDSVVRDLERMIVDDGFSYSALCQAISRGDLPNWEYPWPLL